jgi:hypothetical protein
MSAPALSWRSLFVAAKVASRLLLRRISLRRTRREEPVLLVSQPAKMLSRPQSAGEVIDVTAQVVGKERKHFSRIQHFACSDTRLRRCLADAGDVSGDFGGAL